tara:strand:- start:508 stop:645 length:138 start_codon:yes stop_codon:yes gene_type:complete
LKKGESIHTKQPKKDEKGEKKSTKTKDILLSKNTGNTSYIKSHVI